MAGYAGDFSRLNRRMHNKSFTVDNQVAVVGGRNIGDEYFQAGQGATFADLDVLAIGNVVREVSSLFDRYWSSASAYPAASILGATVPMDKAKFGGQVQAIRDAPEAAGYVQALLNAPQVQSLMAGTAPLEWAPVRLVYDDPEKVLNPPDKHELQMLPRLRATLGSPAASLDLVSPYFVPGKAGAQALQTLAQSGVHVRILSDCQCLCTTMYRIDQPHLLWVLDNLAGDLSKDGKPRVVNRVSVHPEVRKDALLALDRMLNLAAPAVVSVD